ncbi:MAG TPA: ion channel [Candidatus Binatia bacterium]|nr:ion channel [Candidatus Binatia bacterium]
MRKQSEREKTELMENQLLPSPVGFLRGRFSALLIALFLFFLLHTFLADHPLTHYFVPVLLLVTLVTSIFAFSDDRRISLVASLLGLAALALRWVLSVSDSHWLRLIGEGTGALFFAFIAVIILAAVLRAQTVTGDTISGALCVYLLIGLVWAFFFLLVESIHPGSFQLGGGTTIAADTPHPPPAYLSLFLYFSFTTLSTVAYGDVLPLTAPARGLAALEGIVGQFYLAVLVARFVGLYIVHRQR